MTTILVPAETPSFFLDALHSKQIRNCTPYYIYQIFQNRPILLENLLLYCTGLKKGVKEYVTIILLKCMNKPLKGKHLILVQGEQSPRVVDSLTTLKQNLGFEDKICFERSTFLLDESNQQCIRLNTIKHLIRLPLMEKDQLSSFNPIINLPHIKLEKNMNWYSKDQIQLFINHFQFCIELAKKEFHLMEL